MEAPLGATCWSGLRTSLIASVPLLRPQTRIYPQHPQQTCFRGTFRRFHPQQARSMLRIKMMENPLISTMLRMLRIKTGVGAKKGRRRAEKSVSTAASSNAPTSRCRKFGSPTRAAPSCCIAGVKPSGCTMLERPPRPHAARQRRYRQRQRAALECSRNVLEGMACALMSAH